MGKQSRPRKAESFGKGKVTPIQVAFIVDRYLSDNNFPETRSIFRSEASSLISKSPVREAPKSLLSLAAMLDEYICLKEQKVMLDQERVRMEQEKSRVQSLLQGMQNVMNTYNNATATAPGSVLVPLLSGAKKSVPAVPRPDLPVLPPGQPVNSTQSLIPVSGPMSSMADRNNIASSVTSNPLERRKRGLETATEAPPAIKKSRGKSSCRKFESHGDRILQQNAELNDQVVAGPTLVDQASPTDTAANKPMAQQSSVAKCLFSRIQPQVPPPNNSPGPNTPPQAVSPQSDKSVTPTAASTGNCSNYCSPQEITPTNCTIISSERVTVSPLKQMTCYTIERNRCISSCSPLKQNLKRPSTRDHVKSRLDFDGSDVTKNFDEPSANEISTSESDKEADIFDLDFPNFDALGPNFSFSELLSDLDLDCEGIGFPCQPTSGPPGDTLSGSSHESGDGNTVTNQIMSEFTSTVTEVISEKDIHALGPDALSSVKSITKCIRIVSPVKSHGNSLDLENRSSAERLA